MPVQNRNYDANTDESSDESYDSDRIDSDIEAELYSTIHHEVVSTEDKDNPDIERNSSINLISVKENRIFEETESLSPSNKDNMYFGFSFEKRKSNDEQIVENADVSMKRKSHLIANILDNIQVLTESPSKKQKTVNSVNRSKHSASSSRNVTIEISDSDTDSSVILSEPDESSVRKLQTNIETYVVVSSDSDSSFTCPSENNVDFDLNPSRNNNWNGNYKDVWEINDTDLYRTKRKSAGRYHENAVSNCTNCNKNGHVARFCTEPKTRKCFLCGGIHWHLHCKDRICLKCLRFGHASNRCSFPIGDLLCCICNMRGHGEKCCPDLWRRYHLTTSGSRIVKGQIHFENTNVYCCNCGLEGHYGFECTKTRMDRWSFPTFSSVVSYGHPERFAEGFQRNMNVVGNNPRAQQPIPSPRQIASALSTKERKKLINQRNRQKKLKKKLNKAEKNNTQKVFIKQHPGVNSSFLSYHNFGNQNVLVKQEIDFPRTPKVNQSPCVDEMPKIKHTRRSPKLNRKQKKKLQRNQKRAAQYRKQQQFGLPSL